MVLIIISTFFGELLKYSDPEQAVLSSSETLNNWLNGKTLVSAREYRSVTLDSSSSVFRKIKTFLQDDLRQMLIGE